MAGLSVFGVGAEPAEWQQFYTPSTVGFGDTRASTDAENAEKLRQAMLMAQQINQANATTTGMNAQANAAQTSASNLSNLSSNLGNVSSPNLSGGSYTLPGASGGTYTLPGGIATGSASSSSVTSSALSPQLQQQFDPWSQYRGAAASELGGQIGATSPSDLYQQKLAQMATGTFTPDDPSYQWRFNQGQQAVERSLAAKGLLNSGNAAIELQNYGQGAASQEYQAQFDRMLQGLSGTESAYNTQMGRLMQMAGVNIDPTTGGQLAVQEQNANTNAANAGTNAAQVASNYDLGMRDLLLKQYLGQLSASTGNVGGLSGTNWSAVFGS